MIDEPELSELRAAMTPDQPAVPRPGLGGRIRRRARRLTWACRISFGLALGLAVLLAVPVVRGAARSGPAPHTPVTERPTASMLANPLEIGMLYGPFSCAPGDNVHLRLLASDTCFTREGSVWPALTVTEVEGLRVRSGPHGFGRDALVVTLQPDDAQALRSFTRNHIMEQSGYVVGNVVIGTRSGSQDGTDVQLLISDRATVSQVMSLLTG